MATRYRYENGVAPSGVTPAADASWEVTTGLTRNALATGTPTGSFIAGILAVGNGTSPNDSLWAQFIGPPLAAQTITGTVKGQCMATEANAALNARAQIVIRVVSNDGTTVRGTLVASNTSVLSNEFNVGKMNRKFPLAAVSPVTVSSVTTQDGDRIVVELGARLHSTDTTDTFQLRRGNSTNGDAGENETTTTDVDGWIEFSQTLANYVAVTAGDTVTVSDAATRALTLFRSIADTVTSSDAATRALTLFRTIADSVTSSDAGTRTGTFIRSIADTSTFSDAATRTATLFRTIAQTVTVSDAATRTGTFIRSIADSVTASDAATRTLTLFRTVADAVSVSDAVDSTKALIRAIADSVSVSDTATRTATLFRSASDSLGVSDAATRVLSLFRSAADAISVSDAASGGLAQIIGGFAPIWRSVSSIFGRGGAASPTPSGSGSSDAPSGSAANSTPSGSAESPTPKGDL